MLQRSQSLYLFFSLLLYVVISVSPVFYVSDNSLTYSVFTCKSNSLVNGTVQYMFPLAISIILAAVILCISIFLFRKRKLQIRFVQTAQLFVFASIISLGIYLYIYTHLNSGIHPRLTPFAAIPFISLLLNFLAIRGIRKDQALIDSLNRLR